MKLSLLVNNMMGTPLISHSGGQDKLMYNYAPFGAEKLNVLAGSYPGFNGQRRDPVSHSYHLGNGYRAYNPLIMRFNCPDSLSPFGAGGINPYAYCEGDPINRADPSGHISWQAGLGIGLGILGIIATAGAAAMAISAAGSIGAALSAASTTTLLTGSIGAAADITAIASGALTGHNPELSATLGWVSMGIGLAGAGGSLFTALKASKAFHFKKPFQPKLKPTIERIGEPINRHVMFDSDEKKLNDILLNIEDARQHLDAVNRDLGKVKMQNDNLARQLNSITYRDLEHISYEGKRLESISRTLNDNKQSILKFLNVQSKKLAEQRKVLGSAPEYLTASKDALPTYEQYQKFTKVEF